MSRCMCVLALGREKQTRKLTYKIEQQQQRKKERERKRKFSPYSETTVVKSYHQ